MWKNLKFITLYVTFRRNLIFNVMIVLGLISMISWSPLVFSVYTQLNFLRYEGSKGHGH